MGCRVNIHTVLTKKIQHIQQEGNKKILKKEKLRKQTWFFMNTKHIPPFSFPKPAKTVFVMTICEEILCISPIPKILDWRSHLLQAKPYLSPVGVPRDGLLDFRELQAQLKASNSSNTQKRISNFIKTLADCIYRHWCYTPEEKMFILNSNGTFHISLTAQHSCTIMWNQQQDFYWKTNYIE